MTPPIRVGNRFSVPSDWVAVEPGVWELSTWTRDAAGNRVRHTRRRYGSAQCPVCGDPFRAESGARYCSTCFHAEARVLAGRASRRDVEMVEAFWEREGLDRGRKGREKRLEQLTL